MMFFTFAYSTEKRRTRMNKSNDNRWHSMAENCKHLGINRDTVIKWINIKNMASHKIGRLWKFKITEVDDWVRSGGAEEKENSL